MREKENGPEQENREKDVMPDDERRRFLKMAAMATAGVTAVGMGMSFPLSAMAQNSSPIADWIPNVKSGGKKVRIGIPLGYGPYNQPWRRGCWRLVKRVVELGAEPVTMRGQPSKQSERQMLLALLDRNIHALCMGIYLTEQESEYIAKKAHSRGIPTVGFAVQVVDSPAVIEDSWGTALRLNYYMQDQLKRKGTVVQTAENPGFYRPFDMEVAMTNVMTKFEPNMKMLPFLPGGVSTQDETSISRKNVMALLEAHPKKGSINALMSWWWPDTIGAAQALKRMKRTEIKVFNHYFSDQFLSDWAQGEYEIAASTDTPWTDIGENTAQIAVALARGEKVPNRTLHVPVRFIDSRKGASEWLKRLKNWDAEAVAFLKKYGGG